MTKEKFKNQLDLIIYNNKERFNIYYRDDIIGIHRLIFESVDHRCQNIFDIKQTTGEDIEKVYKIVKHLKKQDKKRIKFIKRLNNE